MEIYKEIIAGKTKKIIRKVVIYILILMVGVAVCFFVFGAGSGFFRKNYAIVERSFREALGISSLENHKEIVMGDNHSTSSLSIDSSTERIVNTGKAENNSEGMSGSIPVSYGRPGYSELPTGNNISNQEASGTTGSSNDDQAVISGSDTLEEHVNSGVYDPSSTVATSSVSITAKGSKSSLDKKTEKRCSFATPDGSAPKHTLLLNEIAWMGSLAQDGESNAGASNDEWMEIKNETQNDVSLAGWEIIDTAKNINIVFNDTDTIAQSSLYLLERTDDNSVPGISADKIYSGSLPNTGDTIGLFDNNCALVDFLDASDGWPGGDNSTKRTLERDREGFGWHTSANPGGTPKIENSIGYIPPVISALNQSSTLKISGSVPSSTTQTISLASTSVQKYIVSIAITGDGAAKVISKPTGISCGPYCSASYSSGQIVTLHAVPSANAVFSGWSGPCSGTADCTFTVSGYISVTAVFHGIESVPTASFAMNIVDDFFTDNNATTSPSGSENTSSSSSISDQQSSSTQVITDNTTSTQGISHLVIAAVQIAGASTTNDFVKIYNQGDDPVDIGGWKLHKKTSSGTDYSLREMPIGSSVPAGGYFTWANSAGGFFASVSADVSSTETLSANNSVALFNASDTIVDAVAWGTGTDQYVEGTAYSTNPTTGQILTRTFQDGVIVDTDNNAADFVIQ